MDALDVLTDGGREGPKLLTQRHRNGVLQLSSPHLDDVRKLLTLSVQGSAEILHSLGEVAITQEETQPNGGWIDIVGGLRQVHVIVGMQVLVLPLSISQEF